MYDTHWASQPDQPLTEEDLRMLYDQGHDRHPEQPEHERLTDKANITADVTGAGEHP